MGLSKMRLFPSYALGIVDTQTILVLVLIVALVFGSARLPKLARSMREARDEFSKGKEETATPPPAAPATPPPAQTPTPAPGVDSPPSQE